MKAFKIDLELNKIYALEGIDKYYALEGAENEEVYDHEDGTYTVIATSKEEAINILSTEIEDFNNFFENDEEDEDDIFNEDEFFEEKEKIRELCY